MVLGLSFLTSLVDFRVTLAVRFRGELVLGLVLICLAYFPLAANSAPGWAMAAMRERPWLLGLLGMAVGTGPAPIDVPYLTGLAMLAALHPRPPIWPVLIYLYCAIALSPSLLILALAMRRTVRAARIQRRLVRALTRYGPISVRLLFLVFDLGLVADALVNHSALW